jgi:hypothetical protein
MKDVFGGWLRARRSIKVIFWGHVLTHKKRTNPKSEKLGSAFKSISAEMW